VVVHLTDDLGHAELTTPPPGETMGSGQEIISRRHVRAYFAFVVDVVPLPVVVEVASVA